MNKTLKVMAALMLMIVLTVSCKKPKEPNNNENETPATPQYVDLGLSSGTLWATFNVGANAPEGAGYCYAWGETENKQTYTWSNYKYCKGAKNKLTKYCYEKDYGNEDFTDNISTLVASDDPATAKWGEDWCTPTYAQWKELMNECELNMTYRNSVWGLELTGPNQNKMFLPAAGFRDEEENAQASGSEGYYWSNNLSIVSVDPELPHFAVYSYEALYSHFATFQPFVMLDGERCLGMPVRPVRANR